MRKHCQIFRLLIFWGQSIYLFLAMKINPLWSLGQSYISRLLIDSKTPNFGYNTVYVNSYYHIEHSAKTRYIVKTQNKVICVFLEPREGWPLQLRLSAFVYQTAYPALQPVFVRLRWTWGQFFQGFHRPHAYYTYPNTLSWSRTHSPCLKENVGLTLTAERPPCDRRMNFLFVAHGPWGRWSSPSLMSLFDWTFLSGFYTMSHRRDDVLLLTLQDSRVVTFYFAYPTLWWSLSLICHCCESQDNLCTFSVNQTRLTPVEK